MKNMTDDNQIKNRVIYAKNGACPDGYTACLTGIPALDDFKNRAPKFATCIPLPDGFMNANEKYAYLERECPITRISIFQVSNDSTVNQTCSFSGDTFGHSCIPFDNKTVVSFVKSTKLGAPLAHFRVEEHLPCSKTYQISSLAQDQKQRDSMYQMNE